MVVGVDRVTEGDKDEVEAGCAFGLIAYILFGYLLKIFALIGYAIYSFGSGSLIRIFLYSISCI